MGETRGLDYDGSFGVVVPFSFDMRPRLRQG